MLISLCQDTIPTQESLRNSSTLSSPQPENSNRYNSWTPTYLDPFPPLTLQLHASLKAVLTIWQTDMSQMTLQKEALKEDTILFTLTVRGKKCHLTIP